MPLPASSIFDISFPNEKIIDQQCTCSEFLSNSEHDAPIILSDATSQWPASKWTPNYLNETWGDSALQLLSGESYKLGNYIEGITSPASKLPYAFSIQLRNIDEAMLNDLLPSTPLVKSNWLKGPELLRNLSLLRNGHFELLLGGPDSVFPSFHYDVLSQNAFVFQLFGEKELLFIEPEEGKRVGVNPDFPNKLSLDLNSAPNQETINRLSQCRIYRAFLKPGETIFVPASWWHSVRNNTVSIAVTVSTVNSENWSEYRQDVLQNIYTKNSFIKAITKNCLLTCWGTWCKLSKSRFSV